MILNEDEKFENICQQLGDKFVIQDMFNKFLELYPEDWKKLKITYSKFNRSNKFGKTIPLPRPEQSLRKKMSIWLAKK